MPYTYEADVHCATCFARRFDVDTGDMTVTELEALRDSEGNPPHEYFDPHESVAEHDWTAGPFCEPCGTCGTLLYAQVSPDDYLESEPRAIPWRAWCYWRIGQLEDAREELQEQRDDCAATLDRVTDALADYARGLRDFDHVRRAAGEDEYNRGPITLAA